MPNNLVLPKQKADKEYFIEVLRALDSENRTFSNEEVIQYVTTRISTSGKLNKPTELHRYFGFSKTEGPGSNKITILGKLLLEALNNEDQRKINDLIMLSIDEFKLRKRYLKINPESNLEGITLIIKALKELSTASIKDISYILSNVNNNGNNYDNCIAEVRENSNSPVVNFENSIQRKFNDNKIIVLLASLNFISKKKNSYSLSKDVLDRYSFTIDSFVFLNDIELYSENSNDVSEDSSTIYFNSDFPRNRIIFGAPGTGKSYTFNMESIGSVDNQVDNYLLKNGGEYERVTFHPDYSYAQFVGTYKPTTKKRDSPSVSDESKKVLEILNDSSKSSQDKYDFLFDTFKDGDLTRLPVLLGLYTDDPFKTRKKDGTNAAGDNSVERNHGRAIRPYVNLNLTEQFDDLISYEYVPGPFMRILVKALKNKKSGIIRPHLLLIEEINRANVAAVFGDVFQLLDRDDSNQSEYPIQASEDMKKYLAKELGGDASDYAQIRIPDNMFIWATMNSADQGVFPMDTAFKRRWDFTYQGINEGEEDIESYTHKMGGSQVEVNWNELRKAINSELITYNINEDKLMGAHFIGKESLKDKETFDKTFKSKVIMYLFDDAAKQKRSSLFSGVVSPKSFKLYSDICEAYDEVGIGIFSEAIKVKFDNQINADDDFEEN